MLSFTIAFLVIIALIIYRPGKFSEGGIALLGFFVLLFFSLMEWADVPLALIGDELLRPFHIVMILITLAVLSTTLDDYGFFKFAAFKAILWSKNNGKILFRNFFILTVLLTSFTSNDVDVLTVTPIILWFALLTKVNPLPYLFAVFVAANTSSMEFLIGNLTNIVIGEVFGLGFVEFFLVMIIPTLVTLLGQYVLLRLIFCKQLPKAILPSAELGKVKRIVSQPLMYKRKNIFVLTVLGLVIIGAVLSDFLPIELWMVTTLGALVVLASNEFDIKERLRILPWNVVVFVLVFIVLTTKLQQIGVIETIASWVSGAFTSFWSSVYLAGLFSAVLSGIINNIPASISLSSVFHTLTLGSDLITTKAIAYGLVVGTNIGALFTPVGALATILWLSIMRRKGVVIPIKKLLGYGLLVGVFSVLLASTVIGLEFTLLSNFF